MSVRPVPRTPVSGPLGGVLRSWPPGCASETRPACDGDVDGIGALAAQCSATVCVLVADDNPVNLIVISALMGTRGLVPVLAADGAEAVTLACDRRFDLILMDLQMPILDGLAATSAIRRFESAFARPAVPVIAYTSASPGGALLAKHGFSGGLSKPCEDQELEDCLLQWCPTYRAAPTRSRVA